MNSGTVLQELLVVADFTAKSAVVVAAAWIITVSLRRASAASRHMVWLGAFCTLLLLPVLMLAVRSRPIAVVQQMVAPSKMARTAPVTVSTSVDIPSFETMPTEFQASEVTNGSMSPAKLEPPKALVPERAPALYTPVQDLGLALMILWLLGVAAVGIHWVCGAFSVRRLKLRGSAPIELEALSIDRVRLARHVGLSRRWELRLSSTPRPPAAMTWGLLRPVILLPQESVDWSSERLEAVLLHELSHVRRFDSLSQLIAVAVCALYWFNPAVWLSARALRAEAEIAADDTVIRLGIKPSDYARELLRMASELGHRKQPLSHIGVPVMKRSKIEARVRAILDPAPRTRRGVTHLETLLTVAIAGLILVPLSAFRAAVVTIPRIDPKVDADALVPAEPIRSLQTTATSPVDGVCPDEVAAVRTKLAHRTMTSRVSRASTPDPEIEFDLASAQGSKAPPSKPNDKTSDAEREARAGVKLAKATLEKLAAEVDRLTKLHAEGVISTEDLDEATARLREAKAAAMDQGGPKNGASAQKQAELEAAKAELERYKAEYADLEARYRAGVVTSAERDSSKAKLDEAELIYKGKAELAAGKDTKAQTEFAIAVTRVHDAQVALANQKKLYREGLVSKSQIDQLQAQFAEAQANFVQAALSMDDATLKPYRRTPPEVVYFRGLKEPFGNDASQSQVMDSVTRDLDHIQQLLKKQNELDGNSDKTQLEKLRAEMDRLVQQFNADRAKLDSDRNRLFAEKRRMDMELNSDSRLQGDADVLARKIMAEQLAKSNSADAQRQVADADQRKALTLQKFRLMKNAKEHILAQRLALAKVRILQAAGEQDRLRRLLKSGYVSKAELDKATAKLKAATAQFEHEQKLLNELKKWH